MAAPVNHVHVSERQPGADEDCLWMSGVEFLREAYDPGIPATHAEGDALRHASGDTGFSNVKNFRLAVSKRYPDIALPASVKGADNTINALRKRPNRIAMVGGKLTNMADHYRRFYPTFTGGHEVYVSWNGVRFWWCDPGGPSDSYNGEPITESQLRKFIGSYGFSALVHNAYVEPPIVPAGEPDMELSAYLPGYLATVKKDASVRAEPRLTATKLRGTSAPEAWVVVGFAKGESYSGSTDWLVRWNTDHWEYTVKANVTAGPTKPPIGGFTQADIDAAVAKQKAADEVVCNAKVSTATATATQAEKDRIASVLGI